MKPYIALACLTLAVWQVEMAVQCAFAAVRRPRPFVKQPVTTPQCENEKCQTQPQQPHPQKK